MFNGTVLNRKKYFIVIRCHLTRTIAEGFFGTNILFFNFFDSAFF